MRSIPVFILLFLACSFLPEESFRQSQQKAKRVKSAYDQKWKTLQADLKAADIDPASFSMFFRIFKQEQKTEIWLKSRSASSYRLFRTYDVCASSGVAGPKRRQGDGQVPEGFYTVSVFNPYSNYHLSLGINYPNASDRKLAKGNPGGDIMIHGDCVTIGCVPLTDEVIKEVYVLAVEARNAGQKNIPVNIFPCRMQGSMYEKLREKYSADKTLLGFWSNIKEGFDLFEAKQTIPVFTVDVQGKYVFSK